MIAALRSEWLLLNRARLWLALGVTTIAFSVVATALSVAAAEPGPARGRGISSDVLTGAGGATAAVIYAVGFGSILMLAAFTSTAANEFTRWHVPRRCGEAPRPRHARRRQGARPHRRRRPDDGAPPSWPAR